MAFPKKPQSRRSVYLDHAAAAPVDPAAVEAMLPFLAKQFANPSALYASAVEARRAVEEARQTTAKLLGTQPDTIIFTGSGTESANLAILGIARHGDHINAGKHIITTAIEHHAVLHPLQQLEKDGWKVTYVPVNAEGQIQVEDVKRALRPDTVLVSMMYANNEIGTILPIAEVGRDILKWRKNHRSSYPYFHTDACQAAGYLDLAVERLHVDLLSLNGSKIYGPKGIGMLYKRRGVEIEPLFYGGGQERGVRSGTEHVAGIVGFARALERTRQKLEIRNKKVAQLRDYFWKEMGRHIDDVVLNGPSLHAPSPYRHAALLRLPNNLNVTFKGVDAEALILYLDRYGIRCSSGSACTTDSDEVSHVLLACGRGAEEARQSIRFTLGRSTTKKDIEYVMKYLKIIVKELRSVRMREKPEA